MTDEAAVLTSPFPAHVSFCVVRAGDPLPWVHPLDELGCPGAAERRRREFLLGRAAAHQAIAALRGSSPHPIGRGSRGQPLWPEGLVGSISHTRGIAVAAVARRCDASGLGLDVERRDRRVSAGVARLVASPPEQAWIAAAEPDLRLKLLFCAKEALFKALFPLAEVFLGYLDAELSWEGSGSGFVARLLRDAAPGWPSGSCLPVGCRVGEEHLLSWVVLPALDSTPGGQAPHQA